MIVEIMPYLRHGARVDVEHHKDADGHEDQSQSEDRVEAADQFVDR